MRLRDLSIEFRWMLASTILANLGGFMYIPLMPLYLESLGAAVEQVGLFFTVMVMMAIASRIVGGWISDRVGRMTTIAYGGSSGVIGMLIYSAAPSWEWAMAGALFSQISISLVGPSFQAYTAENAPEGAMGGTFGLVNGLFFICMILGPLIGGFIAEAFGYRELIYAATVVYGTAAIIRLWIARREAISLREARSRLKVRELSRDVRALFTMILGSSLLLWLFFIDGIIDSTQQIALPFMPKFITEVGGLGDAAYTALFALMSLVSALLMVTGGRFADRWGEHRGIGWGSILYGVGLLVLVIAPGWMSFFAGFALLGVGRAFIEPAFMSKVSKAVPQDSLGMGWGVFETALSVLAIPAPLVGGLLYSRVHPEATFLFAMLVAFSAAPLALAKLRQGFGASARVATTAT